MTSIIHILKTEFTLRKYYRSSSIKPPKATCGVRLCLQARIPWWLSVNLFSRATTFPHIQTHSCYWSVWSSCVLCWREPHSIFKLRGNKNILHFQTCLPCNWSLKNYKTDIINASKNALIVTILTLQDKGIDLSSTGSNLHFRLAAIHKWKDTGFDYTIKQC